jgi:hypothetical protein
MAEAEYVTAG